MDAAGNFNNMAPAPVPKVLNSGHANARFPFIIKHVSKNANMFKIIKY